MRRRSVCGRHSQSLGNREQIPLQARRNAARGRLRNPTPVRAAAGFRTGCRLRGREPTTQIRAAEPRSGGAICFVAAPSDAPARVLGFYTLSPASLEYARTPALAKKGLARYNVPVFRLGRGLGGALLLRAAHRCIRVAQDVGGVALLIDAKNNRAARWYQSYGALALDDAPLWPALPLAVAADAIKRGFRT